MYFLQKNIYSQDRNYYRSQYNPYHHSQVFTPNLSFTKNEKSFRVVLGSAFIVLCAGFIRPMPRGTREYNVAEMFINITRYASIDVYIWQACLPDKERVQVDLDRVASQLLKPKKVKYKMYCYKN